MADCHCEPPGYERSSRNTRRLRKREALYAEFISECSKLAIDALDHSLDNPEKVLQVYALENRIKLCSSPHVVAAAAQAIQWIGEQYTRTNLPLLLKA